MVLLHAPSKGLLKTIIYDGQNEFIMRLNIKRINVLSFWILAVTSGCACNGSRFVRVSDFIGSAGLYDRKECHDRNTGGNDFTYDANGNMTTDKDRGITSVKYNLLNLPDEILFSPHGDEISNMYLADGRKLFTTATTRTPVVSPSLGLDALMPRATAAPRRDTIWIESSESTFYLENLVCTQDNDIAPALREITYKLLTPEGYVDEGGNYYYYRRDHLGNVREVWKATDSVALTVQRTRYYPSGLPWEYQAGDSASLQPYKYGGKEFVETHGLDMYDNHARWYDPRIMRPTTMDPLAEIHYDTSPYVWCKNNPVIYIDPWGLDTVLVIDQPNRPIDNGSSETYTADVLYIKNGETKSMHRGSSYPNSKSNKDNSTNYNTINEGEYEYNNKFGHKGGTEKGLNIVNHKGEREVEGTDAVGNPIMMKYVNVHSGKSDRGNYNSRGSQGCITIHPDDADDFFMNFNWDNSGTKGNSTGTIIIIRDDVIPNNLRPFFNNN